jgi:hypothetical protein
MPADQASGGIVLLVVTEPVPMFAEPTGSPGAVCTNEPCMGPAHPPLRSKNTPLNAIVIVLDMAVPFARTIQATEGFGASSA